MARLGRSRPRGPIFLRARLLVVAATAIHVVSAERVPGHRPLTHVVFQRAPVIPPVPAAFSGVRAKAIFGRGQPAKPRILRIPIIPVAIGPPVRLHVVSLVAERSPWKGRGGGVVASRTALAPPLPLTSQIHVVSPMEWQYRRPSYEAAVVTLRPSRTSLVPDRLAPQVHVVATPRRRAAVLEPVFLRPPVAVAPSALWAVLRMHVISTAAARPHGGHRAAGAPDTPPAPAAAPVETIHVVSPPGWLYRRPSRDANVAAVRAPEIPVGAATLRMHVVTTAAARPHGGHRAAGAPSAPLAPPVILAPQVHVVSLVAERAQLPGRRATIESLHGAPSVVPDRLPEQVVVVLAPKGRVGRGESAPIVLRAPAAVAPAAVPTPALHVTQPLLRRPPLLQVPVLVRAQAAAGPPAGPPLRQVYVISLAASRPHGGARAPGTPSLPPAAPAVGAVQVHVISPVSDQAAQLVRRGTSLARLRAAVAPVELDASAPQITVLVANRRRPDPLPDIVVLRNARAPVPDRLAPQITVALQQRRRPDPPARIVLEHGAPSTVPERPAPQFTVHLQQPRHPYAATRIVSGRTALPPPPVIPRVISQIHVVLQQRRRPDPPARIVLERGAPSVVPERLAPQVHVFLQRRRRPGPAVHIIVLRAVLEREEEEEKKPKKKPELPPLRMVPDARSRKWP